MTITDAPEYKLGWEWATEHAPELSELFTGRDASTPELRVRLFKEATRRWPSAHDDLSNDLKQVAFVAGAIKAAIQTINVPQDLMIAANEAAFQMGDLWRLEQAKARALETLKARPAGWWRTRLGVSQSRSRPSRTPNDLVNALSFAWRRDHAKDKGRRDPRSRWEVLIDTLGPREIEILVDSTAIFEKDEGLFRYVVDSPEEAFEVVSRPVYDGTYMRRYPGEIVG